jgi:hypothetical protein
MQPGRSITAETKASPATTRASPGRASSTGAAPPMPFCRVTMVVPRAATGARSAAAAATS